MSEEKKYSTHESACVDDGASVGSGTKIWHYSHVCAGAVIGKNCNIGQNVFVAGGAVIGDNVKIQNNVSVYAGVNVEDDVFLGPSCVLTNISNPRAQVVRRSLYEKTVLKKGATIGANATIVCGVEIGRYALVSAGAVVTKSVPDYALMVGVPARQKGWVSRHGIPLPKPDKDGIMVCPEALFKYKQIAPGVVRCLDIDEQSPLPPEKARGEKSYREIKRTMESD